VAVVSILAAAFILRAFREPPAAPAAAEAAPGVTAAPSAAAPPAPAREAFKPPAPQPPSRDVGKTAEPARSAAAKPAPPPAAAAVPARKPASDDSGTPATVNFSILPWGEVYVDGKMLGVAPPLRNAELKPGRYRIEIRNADFPPHLEVVEVKAGSRIRIRHRFR
jgi:hypothetical protein